jgi:hypothetical protein
MILPISDLTTYVDEARELPNLVRNRSPSFFLNFTGGCMMYYGVIGRALSCGMLENTLKNVSSGNIVLMGVGILRDEN